MGVRLFPQDVNIQTSNFEKGQIEIKTIASTSFLSLVKIIVNNSGAIEKRNHQDMTAEIRSMQRKLVNSRNAPRKNDRRFISPGEQKANEAKAIGLQT